MKKISIVIPAYNEEGNLMPVYQRIKSVFEKMQGYGFEIIFVNDGSRDNTQLRLEEMALDFPEIKYIEFSRNFGHQPAVKAGMDYADGNVIISMDGDLQHPPELIPQMVQKWEQGYDIVYTIRSYPKEISYFKRKTSDLFYRFLSQISDVDLTNGGGSDFRLIDASVAQVMKNLKEDDLFLRGLTSWMGFNQTGIEFVAGERFSGQSSYDLKKMLKFAFTGITSFSVKPLYLATYLGFIFSSLSLLYIPYVLYAFLTKTEISGLGIVDYDYCIFWGSSVDYLGDFRNLFRQNF